MNKYDRTAGTAGLNSKLVRVLTVAGVVNGNILCNLMYC